MLIIWIQSDPFINHVSFFVICVKAIIQKWNAKKGFKLIGSFIYPYIMQPYDVNNTSSLDDLIL